MDPLESQLTGRILIAMPGMGDPRFVQSVIYMCAHSPEGAMGLIVNKPAPEMRFAPLLDELGIPHGSKLPDVRIHFGGPVEHGRGFVLHTRDVPGGEGTLDIDEEIAMTATRDILERIAEGRGPKSSILALGYAGWGPGQIEGELASNGWLTGPARTDLVFGRANEHKWAAALRSIGVDPLSLSSQAGRA
jgi:putative transcriptional regulator